MSLRERELKRARELDWLGNKKERDNERYSSRSLERYFRKGRDNL